MSGPTRTGGPSTTREPAIAEYDGGLSRAEAEKRAFKHCVAEWLYRNPVTSDADDGCLVCG